MNKRLLALEEQFRKEKENADQLFEEERKVFFTYKQYILTIKYMCYY
jgi:hypothetical protein